MKQKPILVLPDENSEGFISLMRKSSKIAKLFKNGNLDLESFDIFLDKFTDLVMPYITFPVDEKEKIECIENFSKKEFKDILAALMGTEDKKQDDPLAKM